MMRLTASSGSAFGFLGDLAMVDVYHVDLDLSDIQFKAIGKITAHWSLIEWTLTRIIAGILGVGVKEGRVLAIQMSALEKARVTRLLSELRIHNVAIKNELEAFLKRIDSARPERNNFAHGLWAKSDQGKYYLIKLSGGTDEINRIKLNPIPMSDGEISAIQMRIERLSVELAIWWDRNQSALLPSPDKPQQPPQLPSHPQDETQPEYPGQPQSSPQ